MLATDHTGHLHIFPVTSEPGSPEYLFKTIIDYFLDEITFEGQTHFPDSGRSDTEQIVFITTLKAFRHELSEIIK
jgi:hypothetical protein